MTDVKTVESTPSLVEQPISTNSSLSLNGAGALLDYSNSTSKALSQITKTASVNAVGDLPPDLQRIKNGIDAIGLISEIDLIEQMIAAGKASPQSAEQVAKLVGLLNKITDLDPSLKPFVDHIKELAQAGSLDKLHSYLDGKDGANQAFFSYIKQNLLKLPASDRGPTDGQWGGGGPALCNTMTYVLTFYLNSQTLSDFPQDGLDDLFGGIYGSYDASRDPFCQFSAPQTLARIWVDAICSSETGDDTIEVQDIANFFGDRVGSSTRDFFAYVPTEVKNIEYWGKYHYEQENKDADYLWEIILAATFKI